ncbi:hypothetical protein Tco_0619253 [Tanacetum coccineum]
MNENQSGGPPSASIVGYGKNEVMKEEVIASSNDLSRSIGSYRIHVLGDSCPSYCSPTSLASMGGLAPGRKLGRGKGDAAEEYGKKALLIASGQHLCLMLRTSVTIYIPEIDQQGTADDVDLNHMKQL